MGKLLDDIKSQSDWLTKAFESDGLPLDYTINSFINIDRFFNLNMKNGKPIKRLLTNAGPILFSIGAYIGETFIKTFPGSVWITDDEDPEGELTISVKIADGTTVWPVQRAIKRFQNGSEDSIYVYGHHFLNAITQEPFDQSYWLMEKETITENKPWWKFW